MPVCFESVTEQRLIRVGHCVVLQAEVTYPRMKPTEGEALAPAAVRFNEGYRGVAEAFLNWAETVPAPAAMEAFAALGIGAGYTFDRRLLTCRMTPVPAFARPELTVEREVTYTSRRGSVPPKTVCGRDVWRRASLTLTHEGRVGKHRPKKTAGCGKNSQNLLQ